jgi:hypothetical protein
MNRRPLKKEVHRLSITQLESADLQQREKLNLQVSLTTSLSHSHHHVCTLFLDS